MKKIAIFTEGQTEQIFVRNYLLKFIDNTLLSFECFKLYSDNLKSARYNYCGYYPEYFFLIVDVSGDEKVFSAIKEREEKLFTKGYCEIIGLRDMYCEIYHKRSSGCIDLNLTEQFENAINEEIEKMSNPDKISALFSIMEIEAWFLSMYKIFEKIDPNLTIDFIESKLGYNLKHIDPQNEFYRPYEFFRNILALVGSDYSKKYSDVESITQNMDNDDYLNAFDDNRCDSFRKFVNKFNALL